MKKYLVLIALFISFFSCEPKTNVKKPDNLIAKKDMINILYDMFIINSAKGISSVKFEKFGLNSEKYILRKHNIDSLQFAESNKYYAHDVEIYKSIIESVNKKLGLEKKKYEAIEKEEKKEQDRVKDSIKKKRQRSIANPNIKDEAKRRRELRKEALIKN